MGDAREGRGALQLRPITLERGAAPFAEGSCLVSFGKTRVLCAASVEAGVPGWKKGSGNGWITAEYAMLPRATHTRSPRERAQLGGRTHEIQRLIGRSVRAMVDDFAFGEWTIKVDCDVLQADGGTRTASITGACVAVYDAFAWLMSKGHIATSPLRRRVAGVSVGIVGDELRVDLEYSEDVRAVVDLNVAVAGPGRFVEVQGTGEHGTFGRGELDKMLDAAAAACAESGRASAERPRRVTRRVMERVLLATRSEGKLRELRPIFAAAGFDALDLREAGIDERAEEEGIESFPTFEANALAKARYFHRRSGMPTIADDSGLEVMALGGAPGVHSKRWSDRPDLSGQALDDANNQRLLAALATVADRTARYVCVAAYSGEAGEHVARGETGGRVTHAPSRGISGFGYDPFFLSDELGVTFGDAERALKESISHRGRAFRALIARLRAGS